MKFFKTNSLFFIKGFVAVIIIAAALFVCEDAQARVQGRCDNCHTMHNSQDGGGMVTYRGQEFPSTGQPGSECGGCHATPRENLLTMSCIACHVLDASAGGPALPNVGGFPVPQVAYAKTDSLAAGNFAYVFDADFYGHNVHGFGAGVIDPDGNQGFPPNVPPGYDSDMDYTTDKYSSWNSAARPAQILCAGTYGCHGNREIKSQSMAVAGSHHTVDTVLKFGTISTTDQGGTSGTSYRFLSGIKGGEDSDWEDGATPSVHNEYYGKVYAGRTAQDLGANSPETMSEFCAGCHGNFHMASNVADQGISPGASGTSPWIRHPTDVALPNVSPYSDYTSYKLSAPIARTTVPVGASQEAVNVAGGGVIVFCLSCHRAHASEEYDSLRFSYVKMVTGASGDVVGEGCFACHSDKDS